MNSSTCETYLDLHVLYNMFLFKVLCLPSILSEVFGGRCFLHSSQIHGWPPGKG